MTAFGVALLVIGAITVVVESHVPVLGAIGGPGVVAMVAGAILAVAGLGGGLWLALALAAVVGAGAGALLLVSVRKGSAVRRRLVRSGPERLLGHVGVVRSWAEQAGTVAVDGALWRARLGYGGDDDELGVGDQVVVERIDGLTVSVRRAEAWELVR